MEDVLNFGRILENYIKMKIIEGQKQKKYRNDVRNSPVNVM